MASTDTLARRPQLPLPVSEEGVDVRIYDGFGKPWTVIQRAVFLWSKLHGGESTGIAKRGCIVGEQLRLELPDGLRIRLPRTSNELYETQWACPAHETVGVCMEEVDAGQGLQLENCLLASGFRRIYQDVVDLCYQRIYEDNLVALWAGDRGRLPGRRVLEAKLFRPFTQVLHATNAKLELVGGAIIHNLRVPSMQFGRTKMCAVTYIDDLAVARGSHAGRALWKAVKTMAVDLVVLHSILLDRTLHFWTSCGFRRLDLSNDGDAAWITQELFAKSGAVCSVELHSLVAALPKSDLPLFACCLGTGSGASEDPDTAIFPAGTASGEGGGAEARESWER